LDARSIRPAHQACKCRLCIPEGTTSIAAFEGVERNGAGKLVRTPKEFSHRSAVIPDIAAVSTQTPQAAASKIEQRRARVQRMAQMKRLVRRLGFPLLGATLTLGSAAQFASAQYARPSTAAAATELQNAERDMLARARAEMEQGRNRAPSQAANDDDDAAGAAVRDQAIQAEVDRRIREAERDAELDQLTAALRRRNPALVGDISTSPPTGAPAIASAPETTSPPDLEIPAPARATVLLAMDPGRTGIRALNPTADPILCMPDVCWISRGLDRDARMVPRRKALGPLNTLGDRAGACNDSLTCVFRNIELTGASAVIQPVDLRILKHDRRAAIEVRIDATCRIERRAIVCNERQSSGDYRISVIPEAIAREGGGSALQATLGRTLATARRLLP